jgi:hypothetical protein
MQFPRLGSETLLPKGLFESGPRMPRTLSACADPRRSDSGLIIIIDAYLDDLSTLEMLIFRSSTQPSFGALEMAVPFDDFDIDLPSDSKSAAGRYDKLHEAGMATRFVKGTSGNPCGRLKRRSNGPDSYFVEARLGPHARLLRRNIDRSRGNSGPAHE